MGLCFCLLCPFFIFVSGSGSSMRICIGEASYNTYQSRPIRFRRFSKCSLFSTFTLPPLKGKLYDITREQISAVTGSRVRRVRFKKKLWFLQIEANIRYYRYIWQLLLYCTEEWNKHNFDQHNKLILRLTGSEKWCIPDGNQCATLLV